MAKKMIAVLIILMLSGSTAMAFSISFYGRDNPLPKDGKHTIVVSKKIEPGSAVVFIPLAGNRIEMRQATKDEINGNTAPLWRFAGMDQKSGHADFYAMPSKKTLQVLTNENLESLKEPHGHDYENAAVLHFLDKGKNLSKCIPKNSRHVPSITAFIQIDAYGKLSNAVVIPVGPIQICLTNAAARSGYAKPTNAPFVARADIRITP